MLRMIAQLKTGISVGLLLRSLRQVSGALVLLSVSLHSIADDRIQVISGYEYSQGDYGQTLTTYEHLIPLSISWQRDDWQIKVSNGLIRSEGPVNTVAATDGVVLDEAVSDSDDGPLVNHRGIMDTYLAFRKELPWGEAYSLFMDLNLTTRLPTASGDNVIERDPDYEIMLDLFWQQDRWLPMLSVGYKWLGESDEISLNDVALLSLGLQYTLTDQCQLGGLLDYQQASSSTSDAVQELMFYGNCRMDKQWSLSPYLLSGFSDSSVDYAIGVQLIWRSQ